MSCHMELEKHCGASCPRCVAPALPRPLKRIVPCVNRLDRTAPGVSARYEGQYARGMRNGVSTPYFTYLPQFPPLNGRSPNPNTVLCEAEQPCASNGVPGVGKFSLSRGDAYTGEYTEDMRHGKGQRSFKVRSNLTNLHRYLFSALCALISP